MYLRERRSCKVTITSCRKKRALRGRIFSDSKLLKVMTTWGNTGNLKIYEKILEIKHNSPVEKASGWLRYWVLGPVKGLMCVVQWLRPWGTPKVQEVNVCVPAIPLVRHLVSDVSLLLLSRHLIPPSSYSVFPSTRERMSWVLVVCKHCVGSPLPSLKSEFSFGFACQFSGMSKSQSHISVIKKYTISGFII